MFINTPPIFTVHDVKKAPEDLLLILDMHKQHSSDVVHALNVPDLGVVVAVSKQNIIKHLLTFFTLPVEAFVFALQIF